MVLTNKNMRSYSRGGWCIDIIANLDEEIYEAWLFHEGYAIKHFMYGLRMKDISINDFILLVMEQYTEYTDSYEKEVMIDD